MNVIDFNDCHQYRSDTPPHAHFPPRVNPYRVPIHRYSPPCVFRRQFCTPRDDLIALGYILIMLSSKYANCYDLHFLHCTKSENGIPLHDNKAIPEYSPPLPWISVSTRSELVSFMKAISYNILNAPNDYRGLMPAPFRKYFEHVLSLHYDSKPDYNHLVSVLSEMLITQP